MSRLNACGAGATAYSVLNVYDMTGPEVQVRTRLHTHHNNMRRAPPHVRNCMMLLYDFV
eukprot:SAG31_NODE_20057_length_585_cov_0.627572_1_plen_58_part_10